MKCILRIFFCILLFGIATITANAQPTLGNMRQVKAELLSMEQKAGYLDDTAYINALNRVAFLYADRYPDSALQILDGIPERSKALSFRRGETDSYNVLGNAWQTKGNFDRALYFYNKAYTLAQKIKYVKALPGLLGNIALVYLNQGNYAIALEKFYASLKAAEAVDDKLVIRSSFNNIGTIHFYQGKMNDAEIAYQKTLEISRDISDTSGMITAYNNMGEVNLEQNDPSKALVNLSVAYQLASKKNLPDMLVAVSNTLGDSYLRLDSLQKAADFFETSLTLSQRLSNARATCKALIGLAKVQTKQGLLKEALVSGREGLAKALEMGQVQLLRDANKVVSDIYEKMGEGNDALKYYKQYEIYADSLLSIESERAATNYKAEYEFSKKELEFQRKELQQSWMIFSAMAALLTLLIILWIISRSRKRLSITYMDLQHKNLIIEGQKKMAEETLSQLKSAQAQLIHAEKMASLGELTAGIAHEIQNPLNFVNNFSEVSNELIEELKDERQKVAGERDQQLEEEILNDIAQNLQKINHHGKRADAIVKGMLQHSRSSSGQKETTDINALCDEFLRLSYHGLRAKDKSFNAKIITNFDLSLEKINIIPQDIGRVLLNLINNAFYAASLPSPDKIGINEGGFPDPDNSKNPTVLVTTSRVPPPGSGERVAEVLISIKDNGPGIPQKILDKIFQPFFTTKPSGEGTGLGLSLAYDIVKAHGGTLNVETTEGEGTNFIISLPAT